MSFSVRQPESTEIPVVVEVPHAGIRLDPASLAFLTAPARSIGQDADLYVDDLYARAPALGATLVVAELSRYVCDLNRAETEVDGLAVQGAAHRNAPHGLIWRSTTENHAALRGPLSRAEVERRLELVHRPYHRTLERLLQEKKARFGYAILLCAHSMPSTGRAGHSDAGRDRAEVVPGSRGRTSAAAVVIEETDKVAREAGWTVAHDDPYRGGFSTQHYGRPGLGIHAIQVELSRRLYMDETSLTKITIGFEEVQTFCETLVRRLGALTVR